MWCYWCTQGSAAEVPKIGRHEAQQGPPDQSNDPARDLLLEGGGAIFLSSPMKFYMHIIAFYNMPL